MNTFGALNEVVVSAGAGAIALGFPVVVDVDLGENQVPGALESVLDHSLTVKKSLELRNIKIKVNRASDSGCIRFRIRGRDYPQRRYAGRVQLP